MSFRQDRITHMGQSNQHSWNKKLCFEARDTLYACMDKQPNQNKFRCPDQLYAYEMWCPTEVRRLSAARRVTQEREASMFDQAWLTEYNLQKQTI